MPELQYIPYDIYKFNQDACVVYAKINEAVFTKSFHKNLYLCDCSGLSLQWTKFNSTFEKCNLSGTWFSACIFDKEVMLVDCDLTNTQFSNCIFLNKALYLFLKMSNVKMTDCAVKGDEREG